MEKEFKHIDRLFQEKFKDFDPEPHPNNWEQIASRLDEKKPRRLAPIWWRLGGIAAGLALMLGLFLPKKSTDEIAIPIEISDTNSQHTEDTKAFEPPISSPKKTQIAETTPLPIQATIAQERHPKAIKNIATPANNSLSTEATAIALAAATETREETKKQQPGKSDLPINIDRAIEKTADKNRAEDNTLPSLDAIAQALQTEETAEETVRSGSKWSVMPNVAPVYYNSFGKGSPISEEFVNNSKSGQIQISYGLQIAYDLNNKWAIRSGLHNVNLSFTTDNIRFTTATGNSKAISNNTFVERLESSDDIVIFNDGSPTANRVTQSKATKGDLNAAKSPIFAGEMLQQIAYIEIPLEVAYKIVDKKFGLQLHGGFSSLFLTDNNIYLQSNNLLTEFGKANSLNSFNFSTNIGLGIQYSLSKKLWINVEPSFKYQWNTYSETYGDFRPYSLGVHTGLRLKF
ncbi:MAG: hypothetical protein OIF50_05800 [Flavobacteriaceae bacterium]|nr:hypothetical protein [Flavobacteriaceae bacterium]